MQTYSEATLDRFYKYAMHDDTEFNQLTSDHQEMIECIMHDKLGNSLIREKIVCRMLGVTNNPNMFSTSDGSTTFDGTHPISLAHYEVKTEQHTSGNDGRRYGDNGQLQGVGLFGGMTNDVAMIKSIIANDPVIAQGMFADGRLLAVNTFLLSETPLAADRMIDYASRNNKTAPRFMYNDWAHEFTTKLEYLSDYWPEHISPKYKEEFTKKKALYRRFSDSLCTQFEYSTKYDGSFYSYIQQNAINSYAEKTKLPNSEIEYINKRLNAFYLQNSIVKLD
jgi:hypothetical protein